MISEAAETPIAPEVRAALRLAREAAGRAGVEYVQPLHLLLGLLKAGPSPALRLLGEFGIDPSTLERQAAQLERPGKHHRADPAEIPFAYSSYRVLKSTLRATAGAAPEVDTRHLLLALAEPQRRFFGLLPARLTPAGRLLATFGVSPSAIEERIQGSTDAGA